MGLGSLAQTLASAAIKIAGDIPVVITYVQLGSTVYNPLTDATTTAPVTRTLKGVQIRPKVDEDDYNAVNDNTMRVLVAAADLTGITPDAGDHILFPPSVIAHEITLVRTDSAKAHYMFTIRLPG